jgi:DDE superfamily endonuclease
VTRSKVSEPEFLNVLPKYSERFRPVRTGRRIKERFDADGFKPSRFYEGVICQGDGDENQIVEAIHDRHGAEMNLADDGGSRFEAYVEGLASVIGHKDREGPLRDYCLGLMMPCERKSVEPLAAVTAPARAAAQHQSLLHFVGQGGRSDERVLAKVREGLRLSLAARLPRGGCPRSNPLHITPFDVLRAAKPVSRGR